MTFIRYIFHMYTKCEINEGGFRLLSVLSYYVHFADLLYWLWVG